VGHGQPLAVCAQGIIVMSSRVRMQLACGLLGIGIVTACTDSPAGPHHAAIPPVATPPTAGNVPQTSAYGNGKLFVWALDVHGTIVAPPDMVNRDGSIGWKFPWMRMVPGSLTITGRRLDAPAPPLKSYVPFGYGHTGFQASGVTFPSEGCWQITGKVDHTSVTFVNLVITAAHRGFLRDFRTPPP